MKRNTRTEGNRNTVINSANGIPPKLYRYRSMADESWVRDIFLKCEQYYPSPTQFNDPFDVNMPLSATGTDKEIRNYLFKELKRQNISEEECELMIKYALDNYTDTYYEEVILKKMREIRQMLEILSMSRFKNDILMWSHYADGHTGFCLEFDPAYDDFLNKNLYKVKYKSKYPKASIFSSSDRKITDMTVLVKSKHWKYEGEWRVVPLPPDPARKGIYKFAPEALTGIIFGCEMSVGDRKKVIDWIDRGPTDPTLYQAIKKEREFSLDIVKYDPDEHD